MHRKLYIVAYDVRQPYRLSQAVRIVRGFACGGQKSAYECWLHDTERAELEGLLAEALDLTVDSVALIPLSRRVAVTTLGAAVEPADPAYFYIG